MRYVVIVIVIIIGVVVYLQYFAPVGDPNLVTFTYTDGVTADGAILSDGTYSFFQVKIGNNKDPVKVPGVYIRSGNDTVIDLGAVDKAALVRAGGTGTRANPADGLGTLYMLVNDATVCLFNGQIVYVDIINKKGDGCGFSSSDQGPFYRLPMIQEELEQVFGPPDTVEKVHRELP
jgi:hypothetical protein